MAIYAPAVVYLAVFQRRFLYVPERRLARPSEAGVSGVEELRLLDNGDMLVAWHPTPRDRHPLILYFHGNGGVLVDRAPRFRMFAANRYGFSLCPKMRDGESSPPTSAGAGLWSEHIVPMAKSCDRACCLCG